MNAIPVFSACATDLDPVSASAVAGYRAENIIVLNYADEFTLWLYRADTVGAVDEAGFFNAAAPLLACGDMMLVLGNDQSFGWRIVAAVTDDTVVIGSGSSSPVSAVGV